MVKSSLVIQKNNFKDRSSFLLKKYLFERYFEGVEIFLKEISAPFLYGKELFMKKKNSILNMALAAMFLALAFVMPFLTGQIPQIGSMLCPMHIPVLLCGFVCGAPWGLLVGFIAPLLRSLTLGMPPLFPTAVAMAFELAVYGFVAGLLYKKLPKKPWAIYVSLLVAMVAGRIVWGVVQLACMGFDTSSFGISAFWAGAVTNAIPGIILQIVLIPFIVMFLEKIKNKTNK